MMLRQSQLTRCYGAEAETAAQKQTGIADIDREIPYAR